MSTQNDNPFVLPGFGHSGDMAENPLVASMEMMRQAWQGLAGASRLDQAAMGVPLSPEELDRRIADLKAVENWLRMNLSMLSSTIQALEVQRAMVATLKSFVAGASSKSSDGRSPLEVVLGIHPGRGMDQGAAEPAKRAPSGSAAEQASAAGEDGSPDESQRADKEAPHEPDAYAAQAAAAAQGWWDMVQKQFDTLASATAATLQAAEAAKAGQGQAAQGASADSVLGKRAGGGAAAKSARKAAEPGGAARKAVRKAAAPASGRKSPAKKA